MMQLGKNHLPFELSHGTNKNLASILFKHLKNPEIEMVDVTRSKSLAINITRRATEGARK